MSVWREVQEALYQRWTDQWVNGDVPPGPLTVYAFANEKLDPPEAPHVRVRVMSRPGGPETLGSPGNRKVARRGAVFAILREPPLSGVGGLSDLAGKAKGVFEGCKFQPHGIRFETGDIGPEMEVEGGRWWGVTVELPFDYEEII